MATVVPRPQNRLPAADRRTSKLVGVAWFLLFVNTLGYGSLTVLPFPHSVAQVVTMGSLAVAFFIALLLNPKVRLNPSPYLLALVVLVLFSVASSVTLQAGLGSLLRCARLTMFVATLVLLSRWWRGDLSFVRYSMNALTVFVYSVVLGMAIAPGAALSGGAQGQGRLVGVLWPMSAPLVGEYGAVLAGLALLLWLVRAISRTMALVSVAPALFVMILSHTRTALSALIVALALACLGLLRRGRVRTALVTTLSAGLVVALLFGANLVDWFQRGQDANQLNNLTGRQVVWDELISQPRSLQVQLFGLGLSDKSFRGLSIDNSWLAGYQDQGLLGIAVITLMLVTLVTVVVLRPPSPARACAVFLIAYTAISSYTEVGLADVSAFQLYLGTAAAALALRSRGEPVRPAADGHPT